MQERAILAGFGGQGLMFMGKLTAKMMMDQGLHVTYFPSYGAEVRGGTANCHVIVSSDEIASPIVEQADTLVIMNQPSYERFKSRLAPEGVMLVNVSLVEPTDPPPAKRILEVPATQMASDLGDVRCANMVMMGVYNVERDFVPFDALIEQMKKAFGERKSSVWDLNERALEAGRAFAGEHVPAE
jgi:2-oxoglutarate ferredoxin oxidoreductase subunit gamma